MEYIVAMFMVVLVIGVPSAIVIHETEKAVNNTTIECIETPNICKMRYEYMKLGKKLNEVEIDKLVENQK